MFRQIAFLKLCCAGDILFTTPAIRAVKRAFPDSRLSYIVGAYSKFVSEHNPHIDDTLIVAPPFEINGRLVSARSFLNGRKVIKKGDFDLIITFHRSKGIAAMARLGSNGKILGFSTARPFVHLSTEFDPEINEVTRYLDLVKVIGAKPEGLDMEYATTAAEDSQAVEILYRNKISGPFAVVAPCGGVNPGSIMLTKRWPVSRYKEVANYLRHEYGLKIVAIGSESERQLAEEIEPDVNLAGQTTFVQLASILKKAVIMIGNDSGPLYLADAVKTKTIGIYGPTSPAHFGTYSKNHRALVSSVFCQPCHRPAQIKRGFIACPTGTWACMLCLQAEEIKQAIDELLLAGKLPMGISKD